MHSFSWMVCILVRPEQAGERMGASKDEGKVTVPVIHMSTCMP